MCGILLSSCRWLGWVNRFPVAHAQDRQEKGVVWLQYNYGHMGRQIERKIVTVIAIARWHLRAKIGSRLAELRSTNEVLYKFACSCCCWWQWREKLRTEAKAAQNSTLRSALSLPPFLPLSHSRCAAFSYTWSLMSWWRLGLMNPSILGLTVVEMWNDLLLEQKTNITLFFTSIITTICS